MTVSSRRVYLVYHIDERLCVAHREAADRFAFVVTREDRTYEVR